MDTYVNIKDFILKNLPNETNDKVINNEEIILPTIKTNVFIKCLLIGSSGVGKSSILERYTADIFQQHFITTIGVDYRFKNIIIDNYNIKLQLWDTASQERFRCITTNYYRNSHIIIVCYDITDIYSFNDLDYWLTDCTKNIFEPILIAICGTKLDLGKKRVVSYEDAKTFADFKNLPYFEISSKDGNGINKMFETLIKSKITESDFIKISVEPEITNDKYNIIRINNTDDSFIYNYQSNCCWHYY
jgi:Ras-related protein Rab-1A